MKVIVTFLAFLIGITTHAQKNYSYSVDKIWSNGNYCAFTSLVKYKGRFYCAFREGRGHVFDENGNAEGKIRIISSTDGKTWTPVLLVGKKEMDFRDPKLCITPDGKLMLSIGVSIYRDKKLITQIPHVCFSKNGKDFTEPQKCTIEEQQEHKTDWVWRTTWHEGKGYATDYFTKSDGSRGICIVTTKDGIKYAKLCELNIPDFPNEATIRFLPSGKMALMVRRDEGDCLGYWALSEAPFTKWEWIKMPFRLGGPDFLMLNDTEIIATSRCHHIPDRCTTAIYTGNAQTATFEQKLVLPSSGDTSYGGMLIEGDEIWISYYSCHETKWPGIYLAKIPLSYFKWQKRN